MELLVEGVIHQGIRERLRVCTGRLANVKALAEANGYMQGVPLPPYPALLFPDRVDSREALSLTPFTPATSKGFCLEDAFDTPFLRFESRKLPPLKNTAQLH